jgi:hypothetical protein
MLIVADNIGIAGATIEKTQSVWWLKSTSPL